MRNAHNAHVGAAPDAALLHDVGDLVDDVHERHRTRRYAGRRTDHRTAWTQEFVGHAGSAASLMNDGRSFRVLHDPGDRIRHIKHEARSKLAVGFAGVNQTRRVWHKLARRASLRSSPQKTDRAFRHLSPQQKRVQRRVERYRPTLQLPVLLNPSTNSAC